LTSSTPSLLQQVVASLHKEFSMSDLGELHHFLGVNVHCSDTGLLLSQQQYALELLDRTNMLNCRPINTQVDSKSKLFAPDGQLPSNSIHYRSLASGLQYLTLT
jgi:hypothetical protein